MRVDPRNVGQAAAWDGDEGDFWAANPERLDRLVAGYDADLFATAGLAPSDQVLDIGCGTGFVTREAARRVSRGSALGVDLSARMLDTARRLAAAEGLTNVRFEQCDAQLYPFGNDLFDGAISRTGTMFFGDPVAAFANIRRALRQGGRLTMLTWQPPQLNPWVTEVAAALAPGLEAPSARQGPGPFSLSDPAVVRDVLTSAGFTRIHCEDLRRPMTYGGDVDSAEDFVLGLVGWLLQGQRPEQQQQARARLRSLLLQRTGPGGVAFDSATWLVSAEPGFDG